MGCAGGVLSSGMRRGGVASDERESGLVVLVWGNVILIKINVISFKGEE